LNLRGHIALLDDSLINRAAPPGSMRYFSVLYAPKEKRAAVTALYVIDAEIRESAQSPNHDVAHTRLQWWRAEVDRLINGGPQHPATRVLGDQNLQDRSGFAGLHELLAAADMDLARMTYSNARELRAYCSRSGGATTELIAAQLLAPQPLDEPQRTLAHRIGVGVRQTEILRDLRQDAYEGRLYLPLDEMDARGLALADLRSREMDERVRDALKPLRERAHAELTYAAPETDASRLGPLHVIAALHRRLLDRIAARNYDVAAERIELGPIEKPWAAWRAARSAG
jgi:15-cis-phytoene synthase